MKPYGLGKKTKGLSWKKDYHIIEKCRKIMNWWEEFNNIYPRKTIKQNFKRAYERELW